MLGPRQKQLVDVLRSGRFIQGSGSLQSSVGKDAEYCCLGVACKIAEESGVPLVYGSKVLYGGDLSDQLSVKSWFGFRGDYGGTLESFNTDLVNLNDHLGLNFSKIADIIEEHASSIFTEPL